MASALGQIKEVVANVAGFQRRQTAGEASSSQRAAYECREVKVQLPMFLESERFCRSDGKRSSPPGDDATDAHGLALATVSSLSSLSMPLFIIHTGSVGLRHPPVHEIQESCGHRT